MGGRDASEGAHHYAAEASWAENSVAGWIRTPIADKVDPTGLEQAKIEPRAVKQLRNEGTLYIPGPMNNALFTTSYEFCGHGSPTDGAMAATKVPTLLKHVFGYAPTPPAGTTFSAGWDTDSGNLAAASGYAGWLGFAGVKGDGRGGGQPALFATHAANAAVLLNALPAAPNNLDVLHSAELVHTVESPTDAQQIITGTRHLLQTADQMYKAHGCFPKAFRLTSTQHGEVLGGSIDWGASYFIEQTAEVFPTAATTDEFVAAHNGGGSMHFQEFGVTTRSLVDYRELTIDIQLGIAPQPGPGGVFGDDGQLYVGAKRLKDVITMEFVVEADNAGTTTWLDKWRAEKFYTCVLAFNLRAGKRMAIAGPKVCITKIVRQTDRNGINVAIVTCRFHANPAGVNEAAKAALLIAFG